MNLPLKVELMNNLDSLCHSFKTVTFDLSFCCKGFVQLWKGYSYPNLVIIVENQEKLPQNDIMGNDIEVVI